MAVSNSGKSFHISFSALILADLVKKNIIRRKFSKSGRIAEYAIVTDIAAWDPKCIDLAELLKSFDRGLYTNHTNRKNLGPAAKQPVIGEPEPYSYAQTLSGILTDKIYFCESQPYQLAELLLEMIQQHKPDFKTPNLQKWAEQMEVILNVDKRTATDVREVIQFAVGDHFRQNNILSVIKLRRKYDDLNELRRNPYASPPDPAAKAPNKPVKEEPKPKKKSQFEPFYDA